MRGCLAVLAMGALVLLALIAFALPTVASAVIRQGIVAGGLSATDLSVDVVADPSVELLGLHADRIVVSATDATWQEADVGRLDLTLTDVDLGSRRAADVEGSLIDVRPPAASGGSSRLPIDVIALSGPSSAVEARISIASSAAETFVASRVQESAGIVPGSVRLSAPDRMAITVGPVTVEGRLAVGPDGSLRLETGVSVLPSVTLIDAGSLPIRLTGVSVTDRALLLTGVLEGTFGS